MKRRVGENGMLDEEGLAAVSFIFFWLFSFVSVVITSINAVITGNLDWAIAPILGFLIGTALYFFYSAKRKMHAGKLFLRTILISFAGLGILQALQMSIVLLACAIIITLVLYFLISFSLPKCHKIPKPPE